MGGQDFCRLLPHLSYAEGAEQPGKSRFLAVFYCPHEVCGGLVPHALKSRHGPGIQVIQVGGVLHHAAVNEAFAHRDTQALNVHGFPGGEVGDVPQPLGGTLGAGAAQSRSILVPDHGGTTFRAPGGHHVGNRSLRAFGEIHRQHLGDDLACLLQQHRIPDTQVQAIYIVLIVESRCGNGGSGQAHGLHYGLGGQHSCAAHLHYYIQYPALLLLRGIFKGHGPAGGLGGTAQTAALAEGVQLDNCPVHIVGQLSPVLSQPLYALNAVFYIVVALIRHHRESHFPHGVQALGMARIFSVGTVLQVEADDIQLPGRRHLGVQLAHGAGGGIAGIGQKSLSPQLPLGIQLLKNRLGHIHFTPDDKPLRGVFYM